VPRLPGRLKMKEALALVMALNNSFFLTVLKKRATPGKNDLRR